MKSAFRNANMASSLALVVICILSTSSYSSPTTDLLETVSRLLRDCSRFYPHADRNMAENLVVRLQVYLIPEFGNPCLKPRINSSKSESVMAV